MRSANEESVAVVIPLFNKARWIGRAVDSVLAQTWKNIDLVVVDDGSEDASAEIVAKRTDPRIRTIRQTNRGPGFARNVGWKASPASVVAFLDADDHWDPDFLEHGVSILLGNPSLAACTSCFREIRSPTRTVDTSKDWRSLGIRDGTVTITPETSVHELRTVLSFMFPQATMVRRHVLERLHGFYEQDRCSYGEDSFLWLRMLLTSSVHMSLETKLTIDRTASGLSTLATLGSRPIEPILTSSGDVRSVCPPELRMLLDHFLAERAYKRSCTLAAVGRWHRGAELRREFFVPGTLLSRYGLASLALTNPLGGGLARLVLSAWRLSGTAR